MFEVEVEVEARLQQYSQPVSKGFPWRQVWDHWLTQVNTGQLNFGMASVKVGTETGIKYSFSTVLVSLNRTISTFWLQAIQ